MALTMMRPITMQPSRLMHNMTMPVLNSGTGTPVLGSPALTPLQSPRGMPAGASSGALAHPAASTTAVFSVPAPASSGPSARVLVYGDSLTAGLPSFEPYAKALASSLAAEGVSAEVVGCGLCSTTAAEMAHSLDAVHIKDCTGRTGPGLRRLMKEQGPFDLVMIMAGTNDLGIPTVAISIPESSVTGTSKYPEAAVKWRAANKALASWAKAEQDVMLADSSQIISFNPTAIASGLWEPDELHFTAAGSRTLGSGLAAVVAPLVCGKQCKLSQKLTRARDSSEEGSQSPTKSQKLTRDRAGSKESFSFHQDSLRSLAKQPVNLKTSISQNHVGINHHCGQYHCGQSMLHRTPSVLSRALPVMMASHSRIGGA